MIFGITLLVIIIMLKFNNNFYSTSSTSSTNTAGNTTANKFQIVVKEALPKTFSSGVGNWKNHVTVESIKYKFEDGDWLKVIKTYWSGTAGSLYKGSNYSTNREVGYKLYDPAGLVIESGTFRTKSSLKENEIFKDDLETLYFYEEDFHKLNQPGTYVLELMDSD